MSSVTKESHDYNHRQQRVVGGAVDSFGIDDGVLKLRTGFDLLRVLMCKLLHARSAERLSCINVA